MRIKFIRRLALMLCMGALFFSTAVYASDGTEIKTVEETEIGITDVTKADSDGGEETLSVDAVWLEGDTLHVEVTDKGTGVNQELELNLLDYANGSEYVSVQAVNRAGAKSNTIQFKNPYYEAPAEDAEQGGSATSVISESSVPDGESEKPFTPDGTGEVVDNAAEGDGKEFFSITTDNGNVFYLIVDRQRNSENVYLLNAVTEGDLAALANGGDGQSVSAIPQQTPAPVTPTEEPATAQPEAQAQGSNNSMIIFVAIAAVAVGGAGYYFKILRPKQQAAEAPPEEYEDDEELEDPDEDLEDIEDDEGGGEK